MKIVFCHGIGRQKGPRTLKYLLDTSLFGKDMPNSDMAYWSDICYPDLDMQTLLPGDEIKIEILKNFTRAYLKDVETYFYDEPKRKLIQERLLRLLVDSKEPVLVVGHSLGSVIAYEVLSTYPGKLNVPMFITLGAPLGIEFILAQLRQNLGTNNLTKPWCVKKWHNFADPFDIVAADKFIADNYAGKGIEDKLVFNVDQLRTDIYGPHSFSGYLKTKQVRESVVLGMLYDNPVARVLYNLL